MDKNTANVNTDNTNVNTGLEGLGRCIGDVNFNASNTNTSVHGELWLDISKLRTDKNEYLKEWMRKTGAFGIDDIDDNWFSVTIKGNSRVYIVTACGNEAYEKCVNIPGANYVAFVTEELGLMDKSELSKNYHMEVLDLDDMYKLNTAISNGINGARHFSLSADTFLGQAQSELSHKMFYENHDESAIESNPILDKVVGVIRDGVTQIESSFKDTVSILQTNKTQQDNDLEGKTK